MSAGVQACSRKLVQQRLKCMKVVCIDQGDLEIR